MNQSSKYSERDRLRPVASAQLTRNMVQVVFDGPLADPQQGGSLSRRFSIGKQREHFKLSLSRYVVFHGVVLGHRCIYAAAFK
jgi:hypothetical protein